MSAGKTPNCDPHLNVITAAWPHLLPAMKSGIYAMIQAARIVNRRENQRAQPKPPRATPTDLVLLRHLSEHGPTDQAELCKVAVLPREYKTALNRRRTLAAAGLVAIENKIASLTALGRETLNRWELQPRSGHGAGTGWPTVDSPRDMGSSSKRVMRFTAATLPEPSPAQIARAEAVTRIDTSDVPAVTAERIAASRPTAAKRRSVTNTGAKGKE